MEGAQRFGRYTVTGTLGRGAMGHVYAAVDEVLGRAVAVKTLHGDATGVAARMLDERFRLEARAVAALNHPGIVQVYDIDLAAVPPYLVMERMAGPSLAERFAEGPLPPADLRALGIQIAQALAAAHAAGIVHRDVKPANILVAGPRAWKLADFGVAHVPDSSLTMTGQFVGSPAYAPPEALLRGQSTTAGDVFGLGATLYYGATGRWPRAEATTAGLLAPVPSVRTLAPDLPEDLIVTIDRAVEIEPDARPTAAQLADAFAGATPFRAPPAVATQFVPDATTAGASNPPPIETAFVPDATHLPTTTPTPTPTTDTAFVPDATRAGTSASSSPVRWKPWAIGAAIAVIAVIAVTSSKPTSSRTGTTTTPTTARPAGAASTGDEPTEGEPAPDPSTEAAADPATSPETERVIEPPPPGRIRALSPPLPDRAAAEDWRKIVDELYEHKFGKARQKLDRWERQWGESPETRSLRDQLDALPPHLLSDD